MKAANLRVDISGFGGVREAEAHDLDVLPHMYGLRELARLFPVLEAPPPGDNAEDWEPVASDELEDEFRVHRNLPRPRAGVAA
jgi:hypothetical protein